MKMIRHRGETRAKAHDALEKDLRQMILRGKLEPGLAIASEPELAREYGISRNTARKALANLESEGLVRKIHGKGNFITFPEERQGGIPSSSKVVLAIPDHQRLIPENAYDFNLVSGCLENAFMSDSELKIVDSNVISLETLLAQYDAAEIAGVIWDRPGKNAYPVIEAARDDKVPQVTISRSVAGVPSVFFDVERALRETVEFLAGIGHRDIAFIDRPWDYPIYANRRRVFVETLRAIGQTSPEDYLCLPDNDKIHDAVFDACPPSTAIIAATFAIDSLLAWIERKGFRIPYDVSLIALSSENAPLLKRHPEIGAILDPRREIGRAAMALIADQIASRDVSIAPRKINGELLVRKSCVSPSMTTMTTRDTVS